MDKFVGKWHMTESTNFDDYMKAIGVPLVTRELAKLTKPTQEITVNDGWTTIKTSSSVKSFEIKFKIDEEFDEHTADDKNLKSIVRKESDTKFVQTQHREEDCIITRELIGDEYVLTLKYKNVTAVRKYKK